MSKIKIGEYFNPAQHLVFHQDKEGNMIGGGYQVNNLLYQQKMPLFVSTGDGNASNMGGGGAGVGGGTSTGDRHDHAENKHFIPEKFSDLFQDLAVPAGLFMMPALFRPRNYAFETPEPEEVKTHQNKCTDDDGEEGHSDSDSDNDSDRDSDHDREHTKQVPSDIFDTLLSMVTPTERIQHDVKTRRRRGGGGGSDSERKAGQRKNRTRRRKMGVA